MVGAHLDTVPQAPGAEDNASGISVLLAVAEARRTGPGCRWSCVAFGAEEPRGPGDADHHFGSRAYVADARPASAAVPGMVSLDRVGVGTVVPVCIGAARDRMRPRCSAAAPAGGRARGARRDDRSSDHESFGAPGLPRGRLGGTPYAGYHSAADLPAVIDPPQLRRTVRMWAVAAPWLRSRRAGSGRTLVSHIGEDRRGAGARTGAARSRRPSRTAQPHRLELGRPRTSPRATTPSWSAEKSMSKTKLPSECTIGTPSTEATPCTQCG